MVLLTLRAHVNFFTWNNKQYGVARVLSKLDRMLANQAWHELFESVEVNFQCERDCDHSLALLIVFPNVSGGKRTF